MGKRSELQVPDDVRRELQEDGSTIERVYRRGRLWQQRTIPSPGGGPLEKKNQQRRARRRKGRGK